MTQTLDSATFAAMRQLAEIVYNCKSFDQDALTVKTPAISGTRVIHAPDATATISKIQLTMLRAIESGIPPLIGLYNIVWYGERPCVWGDVALAMVQKHKEYGGHEESYDEATMTAHCVIQRGIIEHEGTFSWDDAVKAKISRSEFYLKYPKRMLQMRARALAIRNGFADALSGLSIADEMRDAEAEQGGAGGAFGGVREDQDAFTRAAMADAPTPDGRVDFGVLAQKATDFLPPPRDGSATMAESLPEYGGTHADFAASESGGARAPDKPKRGRKKKAADDPVDPAPEEEIRTESRTEDDDIDDIYTRIAAAEKRQQDRLASGGAEAEENPAEGQICMTGLVA